ncbi:MAG: hypothetical protein U0168_30400 [Nannocystaceae bacterium]
MRALLMTVVEGDDAIDLDATRREAVWHAAGPAPSLDAIAIDDDPVPLADAIARRFARLGKARAHLRGSIVDAVAARVDPSPLGKLRAALRHRDFAPRNSAGRARGRGGLRRLRPCARGPCVGRRGPGLSAAERRSDPGAGVRAGLGCRGRCHGARAQLRQLLLHGLCTATWGRAHGAAEFIAAGDETLDRVLADDDVLALGS